jgi:uncharacterized phage-associated protein
MEIKFKYNKNKAIETIIYLARRMKDAEIYNVCKLLYFADKTSLEKYGRFIYGESYVAMENGATPSHAYNILNDAKLKNLYGIKVDGFKVITTRNADKSSLSETDIECINVIIESYGNKPGWCTYQDAHDEAYHKSWDNREDEKESVPILVANIAKSFDNSKVLIDYLKNRDKE